MQNHKRFVANLVEHMPISSIRRKMKDDEELKKIVLEQRLHKESEQRKTRKDRDLELFSRDLFKYLLYRRLGLTEYCNTKKTLEEETSNFHPHIGMSILCCCYCMQKHLFVNFIRNELERGDLDSIACYFTNTAVSLHSINENIFRKLIVLACITLELSVFCYLQGNRNVISNPERLYFSAFEYYFKEHFYNSGGWTAWKEFVADDVKFYEENQCEIPIKGTKIILVNGWLKRFDRWIARYVLKTACNVKELTSVNNVSDKQHNFANNSHDTTSDTTFRSEDVSDENELEETKYKCLLLRDCPETKKYENISNYLILDLIEATSRSKDSDYEYIYQILEKDVCVKELMRYCIFTKVILLLKHSKIRMRNNDILQFLKLILQKNLLMAVYCASLVNKIYEALDEMKSKQKETEGNIGKTAENHNEQGKEFNTELAEHLSPTGKQNVPYQEHKNLLESFLTKIKPIDKPCNSSASQICEILSDETKAKTLLDIYPFRKMMQLTVRKLENRWKDEWILSLIKLILNNSQARECVCKHQSTIDDSRELDYPSNKVSVINVNPQLLNFIPYGVIQITTKPPVSRSDYVKTKPVCNNNQNTEEIKTHSQNAFSENKRTQNFNCNSKKQPIVKKPNSAAGS